MGMAEPQLKARRGSVFEVLCRKHRNFERSSNKSAAFRLPLRHEMGDYCRLGSGNRNPAEGGGPRGPSKRERASHWAGERWCSEIRGRSSETCFLQSMFEIQHSVFSMLC